MAPSELVDYVSFTFSINLDIGETKTRLSFFKAKRVVLYLGRSQPVKILDELMSELQTVETLNCSIERTETPPFYRYISWRVNSKFNGPCSLFRSF